MELYPRTNKIKLFSKPLVDDQDEYFSGVHDGKRKYF